MTTERWQRIEQLYHAALDREASQRTAFLNEVCAGDAALRQEVESLLAHEDTAERFMGVPALEVAAKVRNRARIIPVLVGQAESGRALKSRVDSLSEMEVSSLRAYAETPASRWRSRNFRRP